MQTVEQAARTLGLTTRQLRRRLEETSPLITPYVRRGEKNRLLLDPGAVRILGDIEQRRADGATIREAMEAVADHLGGNGNEKQGQDPGANGGNHNGGEVVALRELVEHLQRDRDHWRNLALQLQEQIALPRPRRPWWAFWR